MAIRTKSIDDMIREIIVNLSAGQRGRPAFTMIVGSGFSYPVIPTPTQMVRGDVAWWSYFKQRKFRQPFCSREQAISQSLATEAQIAEFEQAMWKGVHAKAAERPDTAFRLDGSGLPDLDTAQSTGLAYQAVMSHQLSSNNLRRQYLRDAIQRTSPRVNAAHVFLGSILAAQESEWWEKTWGAPFCRTIFTTNFDALLQRSLQLVNKLYYMSDRPDVLDAPDDDESTAVHLVYTHGSVHRYDLLNTPEQIEAARDRNAPALIEYFRKHGVIVIGYSGWADTTMGALLKCSSFDSNLYWCDIHPASSTQTRLRPEVLRILESPAANAYYVPITGADDAMRALHLALDLGPIPSFIRDPVGTVITQLESIEVTGKPAVAASPDTAMIDPSPGDASRQEASPVPTTLADLLAGTLTRLRVAKSAFDEPSIVHAASAQEKQDLSDALIARLFSDFFVAYSQENYDHARDLLTAIVETRGIAPTYRATALLNRGVAWGRSGDSTKAIADYTSVIEMAEATAEQRALALYNRGVRWGQSGDTTKEIADYTTLIDMDDAPAEHKAQGLFNRAVTWGQCGDQAREIDDYTALIAMADAPDELRAQALYNRGITWGRSGDAAREIADYSAIIDMPTAPTEQKAKALYNRGLTWSQGGDPGNEAADYTAVIAMLDAPAEQRAKSLYNRAVMWGRTGNTASEIADYTTLIEMPGVNPDLKARALYNRGVARSHSGDGPGAIADYTVVVDMPDAPIEQKAKALYNRGVRRGENEDPSGEIDDYSALIAMRGAPAEYRAKALLNRGITWGQTGDRAKEIADHTAVVQMTDAPLEEKARAVFNRATAWGHRGDTKREVDDYTTVIEMSDAPVRIRAQALFNRGVVYGQNGNTERAIADYTAALEMPDVPSREKAQALFNRGVTRGHTGDTAGEIADYTAILEMPDAPADQRAKALLNRGITWGQNGDTVKEFTDYTSVIDMPDAPAEQVAKALLNRGITWGQNGDTVKETADYTAVIELADAPPQQKAKALLSRAITWDQTGDTARAIDDYTQVIEMTDAPAAQRATASRRRGWTLYMANNDISSLVDDSRRALALDSDDVSAHANLALGLLLTGDVVLAKNEYDNLLARPINVAFIDGVLDDLQRAVSERAAIDGADEIIARLREAKAARKS